MSEQDGHYILRDAGLGGTGVCVPRQCVRFCGIVHGQKTRQFFANG